MRKVYLLPNLFTAASLFCGMWAIIHAIEGDLVQASWLLVTAAILDVCDGAIARLTRSTSAFGLNFDSLSDVVAFGVAPSIMVYMSVADAHLVLATGVTSLYTICAALRLARFNVQALREERRVFLGLPTPAAALAMTSLVWIYESHPALGAMIPFKTLAPPAMVVIAYLMVSKVPYAGLKSIQVFGRQPFEFLVTTVLLALMIFMLKRHLDLVLAVGSWTYVTGGLGLYFARRSRSHPVHRLATGADDRPVTSHGSGAPRE